MLELIFHRCDPSHSSVGIDQVFIDLVLRPLVSEFPTLKVVMEHITTADAVAFDGVGRLLSPPTTSSTTGASSPPP